MKPMRIDIEQGFETSDSSDVDSFISQLTPSSGASNTTESTLQYLTPHAELVQRSSPNRRVTNVTNAVGVNTDAVNIELLDDESYTNSSGITSISNISLLQGDLKKAYFTRLFSLLIIFLYVLNSVLNKSSENGYDNYMFFLFRTLTDYPKCDLIQTQVWRLYTNSFIHFDINHIIGNLFFLIINGIMVEKISGYKLTWLYFSSGVLGGTLATTYINRFVNLLGASHGIMALNGSVLGMTLLNYDSIKSVPYTLLILIGVSGIISDVIYYIYSYKDNIGYIAHWVGYGNGLLLSVALSSTYIKSKWKTYVKISCFNIFALINLYLLYDYIVNPYKTNIMNELLQKVDYNSCCLEYIKDNKPDNYICRFNRNSYNIDILT